MLCADAGEIAESALHGRRGAGQPVVLDRRHGPGGRARPAADRSGCRGLRARRAAGAVAGRGGADAVGRVVVVGARARDAPRAPLAAPRRAPGLR